jgi:2'-5' RNA ligase
VRLFVAVDISDDTRAELRRVRAALERELARAERPPRVTWVDDQAAHITLRFIGEVSEPVAEQIRAALVAPIPLDPYVIECQGAGVFPDNRRARVVWLGVTKGQEETARLVLAVNQRLGPIIGAPDDRPFRAHRSRRAAVGA